MTLYLFGILPESEFSCWTAFFGGIVEVATAFQGYRHLFFNDPNRNLEKAFAPDLWSLAKACENDYQAMRTILAEDVLTLQAKALNDFVRGKAELEEKLKDLHRRSCRSPSIRASHAHQAGQLGCSQSEQQSPGSRQSICAAFFKDATRALTNAGRGPPNLMWWQADMKSSLKTLDALELDVRLQFKMSLALFVQGPTKCTSTADHQTLPQSASIQRTPSQQYRHFCERWKEEQSEETFDVERLRQTVDELRRLGKPLSDPVEALVRGCNQTLSALCGFATKVSLLSSEPPQSERIVLKPPPARDESFFKCVGKAKEFRYQKLLNLVLAAEILHYAILEAVAISIRDVRQEADQVQDILDRQTTAQLPESVFSYVSDRIAALVQLADSHDDLLRLCERASRATVWSAVAETKGSRMWFVAVHCVPSLSLESSSEEHGLGIRRFLHNLVAHLGGRKRELPAQPLQTQPWLSRSRQHVFCTEPSLLQFAEKRGPRVSKP